jgi:hypothetical protein
LFVKEQWISWGMENILGFPPSSGHLTLLLMETWLLWGMSLITCLSGKQLREFP